MMNTVRTQSLRVSGYGVKLAKIAKILVFSGLLAQSAFGIQDYSKSVEEARDAFIQRFGKFTQDKNVQGKAKKPTGELISAEIKKDWDRDGGGKLPFQSDLTYHIRISSNYIQDVVKNDPNDPNKSTTRILGLATSEHGKAAAGSGSSRLEREMYTISNKLQDAMDKGAMDKKIAELSKKGISYVGIQQLEVKDVYDPGAKAPTGPSPSPSPTPDKTERWTMRDEAKEVAEKVGTDSFQSISRSAKMPGKENTNEGENPTLLRQAAKEATEAMYTAAVSRKMQRAIGRVSTPYIPGAPSNAELWVDTPTVKEWSSRAQNAMTKALGDIKDPQDRASAKQRWEEGIKKAESQMNQITGLPADTINPKFESQPGGKGQPSTEKLTTGDTNKEDGVERDYRGQLFVMKNGGKSITEMKSNWQYTKKDESFKVKEFDDEGNETGTKVKTVADQIDDRNNQLDAASEGYDEVMKKDPRIVKPDLDKYRWEAGKQSIMQMNNLTESQASEFGMQNMPDSKLPDTYDQVTSQ